MLPRFLEALLKFHIINMAADFVNILLGLYSIIETKHNSANHSNKFIPQIKILSTHSPDKFASSACYSRMFWNSHFCPCKRSAAESTSDLGS